MTPIFVEGLSAFGTGFLVGILVFAAFVLPLYGRAKQDEAPPVHGVA